MSEARMHLIVNADDFGQSTSVNRGIVRAFERGIVTSASLMVRWRGALEAAAYARRHPRLGVGLHVDLGEWACRDGQWVPVYEVVSLNDAPTVRLEVLRQLDAFRRLMGSDPTHLDTHQHVHQREPAREVLAALGQELQVPVRHYAAGVRYCGDFYGQTTEGHALPDAISVGALLDLLSRLEPGVTEMACHPGLGDVPDTMYSAERELEVRALCDARIRERIGELDVTLVSFREMTTGVIA